MSNRLLAEALTLQNTTVKIKTHASGEIIFVQCFYCSIQSMSYICLADGQLWDTEIAQLVLLLYILTC
jgi:hypothetical protein